MTGFGDYLNMREIAESCKKQETQKEKFQERFKKEIEGQKLKALEKNGKVS